MSNSNLLKTRSRLLGCTALFLAASGISAAHAAEGRVQETIVITGTLFNPDAAPAKSTLETQEPQTIINKSYIEDVLTPNADYVTILSIAPSLTGADINGPGLSDGAVKNTLRGIPDGSYGMTYDGIPFGDTNGPTHHSASYFPASTVGSIMVERGPGNAGNLGPSTFGGSINMFSEPLADEAGAKATGSYGTWNTSVVNANVQSGTIGSTILPTRVLLNVQSTSSDGALTGQKINQDTILLKTQSDLSANWTLTAFGVYTRLHQNVADKNGATLAQINAYGKDFALQTTNPALPTYAPYNVGNKYSDMDYLRLKGDMGGFKLDDTVYTYAYVNKTFSERNIKQIASQLNSGPGLGTKVPINGVITNFPTDVPGYTKLNAYRVWGNILRTSWDYDFGSVKGQLRAGLWWETAATPRARLDFDMTRCIAAGINPFDSPAEARATCADASLGAKAVLTSAGYAEYLEHSSWQQYQPFAELDINPTPDLTITPGIKYVWWKHSTNSEVEPGPLKPFVGSFTTTRMLPFLGVNYKIQPSWSVYAQYAQGIYVPDIGAFELSGPIGTYPKAQTTTNYQLGTVFYADNFTFDADIYYIPIDNNIVFQDCSLAPVFGTAGEQCGVNTGKATYRGIEGEATYTFDRDTMDSMLNGVSVFLNGSINSGKTNGLYLAQAPMWTSAGGIIYKHGGWKGSLIEKIVGPQYADGNETATYKIPTYNTMNFTFGYDFGPVEASFGMSNVLNSRSVLAITVNDKTLITNPALRIQNSTDQYYFQPGRSIMFTLKGQV